MASEVELCNLALANIRAGSINSLDEPSLQAQQCKARLPVLRDMLLRDTPWNFAVKIEALALSTADLFNWVYAYQYPSDCLQIDRLILNYEEFTADDGAYRTRHIEDIYTPDLDQQVKYQIFNENGNIVVGCNEPDIRAEYRIRVTDPNRWDTQFYMMLAHLLSAELAVPIVGGDVGRQLRSDQFQIYNEYLQSARASNSNERYTEPRDSEFITIRR